MDVLAQHWKWVFCLALGTGDWKLQCTVFIILEIHIFSFLYLDGSQFFSATLKMSVLPRPRHWWLETAMHRIYYTENTYFFLFIFGWQSIKFSGRWTCHAGATLCLQTRSIDVFQQSRSKEWEREFGKLDGCIRFFFYLVTWEGRRSKAVSVACGRRLDTRDYTLPLIIYW